jgi:hypothetical protein
MNLPISGFDFRLINFLLTVFQVGRDLPTHERGYVFKYNRIIGGLRIIQTRGNKVNCDYRKLEELSGLCYPFGSLTNKSPLFGLPECNDTVAMSIYYTDWEAYAGGIKPCYHMDNYETSHGSAVDLKHNEGFEGKFEMCVICCLYGETNLE